MSATCALCGGACEGADLGPLLDERLSWLWEQVASKADRAGDPELVTGEMVVRAPKSAEARAAAVGLLGGRVLASEQGRRIGLADFTKRLRKRGARLTPGAVAAHAMNHPLATRARAHADRLEFEARLRESLHEVLSPLAARYPFARLDADAVWTNLRRDGWVGRLAAASEGSVALVRLAGTVLAALPEEGRQKDRRQLSSDVTGNPHALDERTRLAALVLAILTASGTAQRSSRHRDGWAQVGITCDNVSGGLLALGVVPKGWILPPGAVVTIPPRVLQCCEWEPPPSDGDWIFITENPSVVEAAADLAATGTSVRLLCTAGTPSGREIAAIAGLPALGWRLAVRADFDGKGLQHVTALLAGIPNAVAWRMAVEDYERSLVAGSPHASGAQLDRAALPDTSWDPRLSQTMRMRGVAAFEEPLMPHLLADLRRGSPT